ncbi:substrate-binding domain-containing protein [Planctomicrobium sp. SH527]|uniref:AraC family transcriptional regulator n=1 Tax=Planctomicrobium sp. SH527 TaxID=3448123 RepID=UPI003F5C9FB4
MPTSKRLREAEIRRQVAVLIDPGDSWGRSVIRGIYAAVDGKLPWNLLIAPRDDEWRLRVPRRWKGDGIIGAIRDPKTAEHVRGLQLPTVNVSSWTSSNASWNWVNTDDHRRAKMAFTHFRERYFSNFAYYGPPSQRYPDQRGECFHQIVVEAGFRCEVFRMPTSRRGWNNVNQQTLNWLKQSPRPLAVFAADPHPAMQLAEICRGAGIQIPDEIAILSGDTDELLCEVSDPPLSSIVLASEQIGAESVRVLDKLMSNKRTPSSSILIPPIGIVNRLSTDTLVVADPHFVEALRFIRKHAESGIKVDDVLRVVPVSRRLLEQRFQRYLKCSPADEIRRVRLERVKELLVSTGNSLEQIAEATGFLASSHLCFAFKKATGQTAREYRKQFRSNADVE